ncbi:beta-1,2-xylosyltransferase XYXT1-like [Malania oleifera]|uniref:beta-1,2-xylosyltransferase XYXT1-like n=1 Tax=Malania oleifera TaxID=397392 RepID=UPI0025AE2751|nr:beta-1,2-xylosyltransferase XYXT1-like [Malania oleifera]
MGGWLSPPDLVSRHSIQSSAMVAAIIGMDPGNSNTNVGSDGVGPSSVGGADPDAVLHSVTLQVMAGMYTVRFLELSRFAPYMVPDEERKFKEGLRQKLYEHVVGFRAQTFLEIVDRATVIESGIQRGATAQSQRKRLAPSDFQMMRTKYDTILARSFSKEEQRKFGCGAFVGCFLLAFTFFMVFKPYDLTHLPAVLMPNLQLSMGMRFRLRMVEETSGSQHIDTTRSEAELEPICKLLEPRSDYCKINGDIRIHGKSSTIFVASSDPMGNLGANSTTLGANSTTSWSIRPYARKGDTTAMESVRNFSVKLVSNHDHELPSCTVNHSVPSVLFSLGGYAGNHFHDFTDVMIPLYSTSRQFNGQVQLLVADTKSHWVSKFKAILRKLSNYEIINIDGEHNQVHCFPGMIVGLYKQRKELSIDPSKSPYSMRDFREFLRSTYSLKRATAITLGSDHGGKRPTMLIISRRKSRSFMNEREIVKMARRLGFKVIVAEATADLSKFAKIVNSCDVLMGVHGAGITNMVFLPERAILIQVVPLGGMGWLAKYDFGNPAAEMNLRYLEYQIKEEESSLIKQYPLDHVVFKDPFSIHKLGWNAIRSTYLDKQNVKLDLVRFRATLLEALRLLYQ